MMMGVSDSSNKDFFNLLNPQQSQEEEQNRPNGGDGKEELKQEILPNYDFQPIHSINSNSVESNSNSSNVRTYGSVETTESEKITWENNRNTNNAATIAEIDRILKKHADNLLHVLKGVSARLSKLEIRTSDIESSVDDLKVSVGNDNGKRKLRQLENILREVQAGVQLLRDKQEIMEAVQLAKVQVSKGDQQFENQNSTAHTDSAQQEVSSQQSHQSLPPLPVPQPPPQLLALPPPNAPQPPVQLNPPPIQFTTQLPQSQIPSIPQREPYFPTPGQLPEATHQQYQLPPAQQLQAPLPAPHQQFQSVPQFPQYSQPSQQHPPVNPSPLIQPPLSHHPEETPYMPPQSYLSIRQSTSMTQPPNAPPPSQQYYGSPSVPPNMYEPLHSRLGSGFSSGYCPPSVPTSSDSYAYSGSLSQYRNSETKSPHLSSSAHSGGSSYPRLPTAQTLPRAQPTTSSDDGESGSGETGNRVPIDDVVDKVVMMGFSRDQVRATVRKLTENGQSVDLNVVLDKLMNN